MPMTSREALCVEILKELRGKWSDAFYNAISPFFALTAIEMVCLRRTSKTQVSVLLARRPDDEGIVIWRNKWYSPGTMLRASDVPAEDDELPALDGFEKAIERLLARELGGAKLLRAPRQVRSVFQWTPREPEISQIFWYEIVGDGPPDAKWFDVDGLPKDLMSHHYRIIEEAVKAYRAHQR